MIWSISIIPKNNAQNIELKKEDFNLSFDSLKYSLRVFYIKKTEAEQTQFKTKIKYKWLKFVPSIGWNFGLNSPVVGYNTNDLVNALNHKTNKEAILSGFERQNEVLYNDAVTEVKYLLKNLNFMLKQYYSGVTVFNLQKDLFLIIERQYQKGELLPSEYLQKKIAYEKVLMDREKLKYKLIEMRNTILIKGKMNEYEVLF